MSRRRVAALLATVMATTGLAACDPGPLLELTVTTTEDLVDVAPGDGACETASGACSLRAAVMEANATPDATTVRIVLASRTTYVLTHTAGCISDEEGSAAEADLDVTRSVGIVGNGSFIRTNGGEVEVPGYGTVPCGFRVFENHRGHLALSDLRLVGESWGEGAALRNWSTAQLTDVSATGTGFTRGIVLHNRGNLTLVRTQVFGARTYGSFDGLPYGFPAPWAGIWSETGSLVLLDSRVWDNAGVVRFGSTDFAGIHVASGSATIIESIVTGHRGVVLGPGDTVTVPGDGIDARAPVRLFGSTVVGNGAGRDVVGAAAVEVSGSLLGTCDGIVTSLGHSSDADGSCLGGGQPTDLVATPTTFAGSSAAQPWLPAAGSAVVDAIAPGTPGLCDGGWSTDVRGAPRPSGAGCDIGALERQPTDP